MCQKRLDLAIEDKRGYLELEFSCKLGSEVPMFCYFAKKVLNFCILRALDSTRHQNSNHSVFFYDDGNPTEDGVKMVAQLNDVLSENADALNYYKKDFEQT